MSSPRSTGGAGYVFEWRVAAYYMVSMLRQGSGPGLGSAAVVTRVALQQRHNGFHLDDMVVTSKRGNRAGSLSIQARSRVVFGNNPGFQDVIKAAWREFGKHSFRKERDLLGIACDNASITGRTGRDVTELLEWAGSQGSDGFYRMVSGFKAKKKVLRVFETALKKAAGRVVSRRTVHDFLCHLRVLGFDFADGNGRDDRECVDGALSITGGQDRSRAQALLNAVYRGVEEWERTGGEVTRSTLIERVRGEVGFAIPALFLGQPSMPELARRQVRNKLAAEKMSRKYIPNVFIETTGVKDDARLFCHPSLFLQQQEDVIRRFDLRSINSFLTEVELPGVRVNLPTRRVASGRFESLSRDCSVLRSGLDDLARALAGLSHDQIDATRSAVPEHLGEIFDQKSSSVGQTAHSAVDWKIPALTARLEIAEARVFAVVSRAGQGKTNFVCDLAERFLLPHRIPCVLLTGRDFRGVPSGQFCTHFARIVSASGTCEADEVLEEMEQEASRLGVPGVIVLDAINESDGIAAFSAELEHFIEKCLCHAHLRVMFTCRSEFYDERFGNLSKSSFVSQMVIQRDIHRRMDERHRARLLPAYLDFFKIRPTWIAPSVQKALMEDVLLLRFFCEAYGDPGAAKPRTIPEVGSLRKDTVFRMYLDRKLGAVAGRSKLRSIVGRRSPYERQLLKTIEWMLGHDQYSAVPVGAYGEADWEGLTELVDEDLLLRKDLASTEVVLPVLGEQLSFTFDEFRDFLLAGYLLDVVRPKDAREFVRLVTKLTHADCTASEGVSHYLFLMTRRPGYEAALRVVRSLPWYDRAFGQHVFELEGAELSRDDLDRIREICLRGDPRTPDVVVSLVLRWDTSVHQRASIETLFDVFDAMTPDQFRSVTTTVFRDERYSLGRRYYPITRLADHLRRLLLADGKEWYEGRVSLARLLLYLWNVPDAEYGYPARSLMGEFASKHRRLARALIEDHLAQRRKGCSGPDIDRVRFEGRGDEETPPASAAGALQD